MFSVLSILDERTRPKGSRDPLGIEAVWSFMGRQIVGNLTTVTSNLENFIVALICCDYAHSDNLQQLSGIQDKYLRAEQLSAYFKLDANKTNFLGISRAKKNYEQGEISLGSDPSAQLLGNQLSYGLWGLYSTALEGAGLIKGSQRRPTIKGQQAIALIHQQLGAEYIAEFQKLAKLDLVHKHELENLSTKFNEMLENTQLRQEVVKTLLETQANCSLQNELYLYANKFIASLDSAKSNPKANMFCKWLLEQTDLNCHLKTVIQQIIEIEVVLAFAERVMTWLQGQHQKNISELTTDLSEYLPKRCETSWYSIKNLPHKSFLQSLVFAINQSNTIEAINIIIKHNKQIMNNRGGGAWVELDAQDKLNVRVLNANTDIKTINSDTWQNSYFIQSFLNVIKDGETWKH